MLLDREKDLGFPLDQAEDAPCDQEQHIVSVKENILSLSRSRSCVVPEDILPVRGDDPLLDQEEDRLLHQEDHPFLHQARIFLLITAMTFPLIKTNISLDREERHPWAQSMRRCSA